MMKCAILAYLIVGLLFDAFLLWGGESRMRNLTRLSCARAGVSYRPVFFWFNLFLVAAVWVWPAASWGFDHAKRLTRRL